MDASFINSPTLSEAGSFIIVDEEHSGNRSVVGIQALLTWIDHDFATRPYRRHHLQSNSSGTAGLLMQPEANSPSMVVTLSMLPDACVSCAA